MTTLFFQDPVEAFIGKQRAVGGRSVNPTVHDIALKLHNIHVTCDFFGHDSLFTTFTA